MVEVQNLNISYRTGNVNDLSEVLQSLISETKAFAKRAYAPYSKFQVSAGAILGNGQTVFGANVENASYPVCICAERNLLSTIVSNYPDEIIQDLIVYVDKDLPEPASPCGLCRQTLVEVEGRQKSPIRLTMVAKDNRFIQLNSCADLLPWGFDGTFLSE
ncbi:MAG: cytidine deaminase [Crocinitomicaceae bacterium]